MLSLMIWMIVNIFFVCSWHFSYMILGLYCQTLATHFCQWRSPRSSLGFGGTRTSHLIFYTSNLYWWGKGWPVDGLPFPDTDYPVPDVSIYYMSNINELPDGILFHWFCKCTPPWMFLPLDIPSEYRPEHVTFGLLCVIFKFPSRIFCRRVPGFATDCPCGVWCRGLTTCLLYVGPPLEF